MKKILSGLLFLLIGIPSISYATNYYFILGQVSDGGWQYEAVVYTPPPGGTNNSGLTWTAAGLEEGTIGTKTLSDTFIDSTTLSDAIRAGDYMEVRTKIQANPDGGTTQAEMQSQINQDITDAKIAIKSKLKYWHKEW